ncbi:hypothetical protein ACA910_006666 [Epithemia clementina (nom. ined.)]
MPPAKPLTPTRLSPTIVQIPGLTYSGSPDQPHYSSVHQHEEEDDDDEDDHHKGASHKDNGGLNAAAAQDPYQDEPTHNDEEDEDGDEEHGIRDRDRRRRSRLFQASSLSSSQHKNKNGVVFFFWLLLTSILGAVVVGLLLFRHRTYYTEAINKASNSNNSNSNHPHPNMVVPSDDDDQQHTISHAPYPMEDTVNAAAIPPPPVYTVHYDAMPHAWDPFDLTVPTTMAESSGSNNNNNNNMNDEWWNHAASWVPWLNPNTPVVVHDSDDNDDDDRNEDVGGTAYLIQPHVVNDTLVFVAEGDLYITRLSPSMSSMSSMSWMYPAWKLSTTVGNVRTPRLHPTLPLIAYTATYTGHREVYLHDLRHRPNGAPQHQHYRLTYWNGQNGVSSVVGWIRGSGDGGDATTLLISALSQAVSLHDTRLYKLVLACHTSSGTTTTTTSGDATITNLVTPTPLEIIPIPLTQALDGCYYHPPSSPPDNRRPRRRDRHLNDGVGDEDNSTKVDNNDEDEPQQKPPEQPDEESQEQQTEEQQPNEELQKPQAAAPPGQECLFFTRFHQSSQTIRYVGGTVEALWLYCDGQDQALALTSDYNGTSKDPQLYPFTILTAVANDNNNKNNNNNKTKEAVAVVLFLSDRAWDETNAVWYPTTMNLWALPLPSGGPSSWYQGVSDDRNDYTLDDDDAVARPKRTPLARPVALTQISCQFNGQSLQEYSVDAVTGRIVLRVGADFYTLTREQVMARYSQETSSSSSSTSLSSSLFVRPTRLPIHVYSDFHETQERLIPLKITHFSTADVMEGVGQGNPAALLTVRGQAWVSPATTTTTKGPTTAYQGAGQALPERTYRLAPGTLTGGALRVLVARSVPLPNKDEDDPLRMALILATNPLSPTAELAFYLVQSQAGAINVFNDLDHLPEPFLENGLGSIYADSVVVSPCGRRVAWADTNGRICVMNLPLYYQNATSDNTTTVTTPEGVGNQTKTLMYSVLPRQNELGEPIVGSTDLHLSWSPGGRYLAINHFASNQFFVISIADCGVHDPTAQSSGIITGRIVQATPSRFNSIQPCWGSARADATLQVYQNQVRQIVRQTESSSSSNSSPPEEPTPPSYSTLYFLTDRDVMTDTSSPWGTRMPLPHFSTSMVLYALPLDTTSTSSISGNDTDVPIGRFSGGGAMEVMVDHVVALKKRLKETTAAPATTNSSTNESDDESGGDGTSSNSSSTDDGDQDDEDDKFPKDLDIDFGPKDLSFARKAYRMVHIPKDDYVGILSQTPGGDFALVTSSSGGDKDVQIKVFVAKNYPSDGFEDAKSIAMPSLLSFDTSTCRRWIYLIHSDGSVQVVPNDASNIMTAAADKSVGKVATEHVVLSVWPILEYKQMYNDAWRMLRDYFWDSDMHKVNWEEIHKRYLPLVERCTKREDLDDVLSQMASELSALHVFVYGGEYNLPFEGDSKITALHEPASLGATLQRTAEWKGYKVTEIAYRDPDYNLIDNEAVYSPLSDQALRPSGQKGLQVGDVIVGVNGESVFRVPDIHMLLRGQAGRSVRLEVLRLASSPSSTTSSLSPTTPESAHPEPVIVVPISQTSATDLRYNAWEYKTREMAKAMAKQAGFSVAYIHLRSMSHEDMDAFARAYFEDYNKDAMILDLRHNLGGNIDSWISAILQRKSVYYFGDRFGRSNSGRDMDWNQHFAFKGTIVVVLIDEKTSSDGEGLARAIAELELGFLIGKRTWGGGIWLASDNRLVDGGIATAPEEGVYNEKWGWGMGIEQQGVRPDLEVDNNPRTFYDGKDTQLIRAIEKIQQERQKLGDKPNPPNPPRDKPDMSLKNAQCAGA